MKIKEIKSQHRRDMQVVYECEHCGCIKQGSAYDDKHFHENVIPRMECPECKKIAPENYRPLTTKYPEGKQV